MHDPTKLIEESLRIHGAKFGASAILASVGATAMHKDIEFASILRRKRAKTMKDLTRKEENAMNADIGSVNVNPRLIPRTTSETVDRMSVAGRARVGRFMPVVLAAALSICVYAQPEGGRQAAHQQVPGSRVTPVQRQALESYGRDVAITFDDQEIPASITGRLSPRTYPADAAAEARSALDMHGRAFRRGPNDDFRFSGVEQDKNGGQYIRMAQTYKRLLVIGRELIVHLTKDEVMGISGRFAPDLSVPTDLAGSRSAEATATAVAFARNQGLQNVRVLGTSAHAVFVDDENTGHVVVPVEIAHDEQDGVDHETVFVYAEGGQVAGRQALAPLATGGCSPGQICTSTQLISNPGFESGHVGWSEISWYWNNSSNQELGSDQIIMQGMQGGGFNSLWFAQLGGWGLAFNNTGYDNLTSAWFTIPSTANSATLTFYLRITTTAPAWDNAFNDAKLTVSTVDTLLASYTQARALRWPFSGGNYIRQSIDVTSCKGRTEVVTFRSEQQYPYITWFDIDNVVLTVN